MKRIIFMMAFLSSFCFLTEDAVGQSQKVTPTNLVDTEVFYQAIPKTPSTSNTPNTVSLQQPTITPLVRVNRQLTVTALEAKGDKKADPSRTGNADKQ